MVQNLEREKFPDSISAAACRTVHFLHSKKGPQIHTLRQTAHYRRRRHIKSGWVEKRSVFDGENREDEKKTDPKRVLVCFQVGAVKAAPNTSLQSRPADLTPVGSDVMTDSQRRESTPSTHP